ncbi:MAG: hypothetical protein IPO25_23170 [Saprospiraceae bacterium]|nr:hypothetical protein [Saprospiraceae bacterium]
MKLAVILEKGDRELWGRIENIGRFMPVVAGESKQIVWERLIDLIKDYQANEGRDDKAWKKYPVDKISFSFLYDLQSFFCRSGLPKSIQNSRTIRYKFGTIKATYPQE